MIFQKFIMFGLLRTERKKNVMANLPYAVGTKLSG